MKNGNNKPTRVVPPAAPVAQRLQRPAAPPVYRPDNKLPAPPPRKTMAPIAQRTANPRAPGRAIQRADDDFFASFGNMDDEPEPPPPPRVAESTVSFADSRSDFFRIRRTGSEDMREVRVGVYNFLISTGHGYRTHATGVTTNPSFYGLSEDQVEKAIINDIIRKLESKTGSQVQQHFQITGITASPHFVNIRGVRIQYICNIDRGLSAMDGDAKIRITDYIVLKAPGTSSESPF